jgi:tRNA pseudouridine55 synthase
VPLLHEQPKAYRAKFLLGRRSETDDTDSEVVETPGAQPVEKKQIVALLPRFTGAIEQVPPRFSAVHVEGERAYTLARQGRAVEIQPRSVEVHRLSLVRFEYPELELDIECGSGTYIRSIGRDLGESLGCGAVMSALVRTRVGPYRLDTATSFDDLHRETLAARLLPASSAVAHLPQHACNDAELELVRRGRPVRVPNEIEAAEPNVAILSPDGSLAAIARYEPADQTLHPHTVLVR